MSQPTTHDEKVEQFRKLLKLKDEAAEIEKVRSEWGRKAVEKNDEMKRLEIALGLRRKEEWNGPTE